MIDINSNCSRVDAVKAQANQLKIQAATAKPAPPPDEAGRKIKSELQTLDNQVKAGDAKKAETALAAAKQVVATVQSTPAHEQNEAGRTNSSGGRLDVYA